MLMSNAKKIAERAAAGPLDPKEILREAHSLTDVEVSYLANLSAWPVALHLIFRNTWV